ncbi:Uncharacterized membrane protein, DUF485 family [Streptomyces sp. WMMB 714]|nr:Uncharacterized membrane protein, DUF485 family [Streptomyces sp. WMMB 714]
MRTEDPWYDDALAAGWGEHDGLPAAPGRPAEARPGGGEPGDPHAAVYLTVQRSPAFQQVRRRYRRFVLPATAAFLVWYFAYVVTATLAPQLMARPLVGVFNVAMAAGLAQFATTFLLTWAYVRHARLRRDRPALELRWETQDMTRTGAAAAGGPGRDRGDAPAQSRGDARSGRRAEALADFPGPRTAREGTL